MDNLPTKSLLPEKLRQWVFDGSWSWEREAIEFLPYPYGGPMEKIPSPDEYLTIGLTNPKTKEEAEVVFHRNTHNPDEVRLVSWGYK